MHDKLLDGSDVRRLKGPHKVFTCQKRGLCILQYNAASSAPIIDDIRGK